MKATKEGKINVKLSLDIETVLEIIAEQKVRGGSLSAAANRLIRAKNNKQQKEPSMREMAQWSAKQRKKHEKKIAKENKKTEKHLLQKMRQMRGITGGKSRKRKPEHEQFYNLPGVLPSS